MRLPYRYRGLWLLALLCLALPWTAWHFALHDTFRAWRDCTRLSARIPVPAFRPVQDAVICIDTPEIVLSGSVLDSVRQAATIRSVEIAGYEPHITVEQEGVSIHTARLTLTGEYKSMLQIVSQLEQIPSGCRLSSLAWRSAADQRTRRVQLTLTVYIEQLVLKK